MPDGVLLMVATTKGVFLFQSDSKRASWKMTPTLEGWEAYSVFGEPGGKRLYAGTSHYAYGPSIRLSEDMGKTWNQLPGRPEYPKETGWELKKIWQITPGHASEPDTLYAGVDEAGLFVSRDRGATWAELSGLKSNSSREKWFPGNGGLCLHTILLDPKDKNRLHVGISAVGTFKSTDAGKTWKNCNRGLPNLATGSDDPNAAACVHKIVLDPSDSNRLFMQYHGGVMRSTDAGETWHHIESGLPSNFGFPMVATSDGAVFIVPLKSDENRVMPEGKIRVYRTRDAGESWQALSKGFPGEPQFVGVLRDAMAVDPLDGICFGTTMGEVFYSPDAGENWTKLPGTLPRITNIKACAI